jgi:SAM-dependent methyltransferase
MFKKILNFFKEKSLAAFVFQAFKFFFHKIFRARLVGDFTIASVSTEKKIFSKCSLKFSDDGYYCLDPMPSVEELDEYYNNYYWDDTKKAKKTYGANSRDFLHYYLLKEYIPEVLVKGKVFLNFGAGHGGMSHLSWLDGMEVVNIEPSLLPKFYEDRWVTYADISAVEDASVDLIYGSHSLEHVQDIEHSKKEFKRVLKPNGLLFWEVPNADNKNTGSQHGRVDIPHTYYFKTDFFNKWFTETLLNDGFEQESWKKTNIIENWNEYKDAKGVVVRALGRID